jgi:hypothetical protein
MSFLEIISSCVSFTFLFDILHTCGHLHSIFIDNTLLNVMCSGSNFIKIIFFFPPGQRWVSIFNLLVPTECVWYSYLSSSCLSSSSNYWQYPVDGKVFRVSPVLLQSGFSYLYILGLLSIRYSIQKGNT